MKKSQLRQLIKEVVSAVHKRRLMERLTEFEPENYEPNSHEELEVMAKVNPQKLLDLLSGYIPFYKKLLQTRTEPGVLKTVQQVINYYLEFEKAATEGLKVFQENLRKFLISLKKEGVSVENLKNPSTDMEMDKLSREEPEIVLFLLYYRISTIEKRKSIVPIEPDVLKELIKWKRMYKILTINDPEAYNRFVDAMRSLGVKLKRVKMKSEEEPYDPSDTRTPFRFKHKDIEYEPEDTKDPGQIEFPLSAEET